MAYGSSRGGSSYGGGSRGYSGRNNSGRSYRGSGNGTKFNDTVGILSSMFLPKSRNSSQVCRAIADGPKMIEAIEAAIRKSADPEKVQIFLKSYVDDNGNRTGGHSVDFMLFIAPLEESNGGRSNGGNRSRSGGGGRSNAGDDSNVPQRAYSSQYRNRQTKAEPQDNTGDSETQATSGEDDGWD